MMCPRRLFFGILSGVILLPLQASAFGPMDEEPKAPPARSAIQPPKVVEKDSRAPVMQPGVTTEKKIESIAAVISTAPSAPAAASDVQT
ncbi:MAG: hypothetical protein EOP09_16595, partial [Proteobacteria bacterium]